MCVCLCASESIVCLSTERMRREEGGRNEKIYRGKNACARLQRGRVRKTRFIGCIEPDRTN